MLVLQGLLLTSDSVHDPAKLFRQVQTNLAGRTGDAKAGSADGFYTRSRLQFLTEISHPERGLKQAVAEVLEPLAALPGRQLQVGDAVRIFGDCNELHGRFGRVRAIYPSIYPAETSEDLTWEALVRLASCREVTVPITSLRYVPDLPSA